MWDPEPRAAGVDEDVLGLAWGSQTDVDVVVDLMLMARVLLGRFLGGLRILLG